MPVLQTKPATTLSCATLLPSSSGSRSEELALASAPGPGPCSRGAVAPGRVAPQVHRAWGNLTETEGSDDQKMGQEPFGSLAWQSPSRPRPVRENAWLSFYRGILQCTKSINSLTRPFLQYELCSEEGSHYALKLSLYQTFDPAVPLLVSAMAHCFEMNLCRVLRGNYVQRGDQCMQGRRRRLFLLAIWT